jgi:hypothetical protein
MGSQAKVGRTPEKGKIRRDAFRRIRSGLGFTGLYIVLLAIYAAFYAHHHGWEIRLSPQAKAVGLLPGLLPVAWTLSGLLQLISGVEFDDLSRRWDALPGWERGVIGISVFVGGLIVVIGGIALVVQVMFWVRTGQW